MNITQMLARIDQIKRNVGRNARGVLADPVAGIGGLLGQGVAQLDESFRQDPVNAVLNSSNLGGLAGTFRNTTPLKPDPEVGTRFAREFLGGLAEKKPVNLDDLRGSSMLVMPWDSTSRNFRISSVSEEALPQPIITQGGQDYARDLGNISNNVAGASNAEIARRVQDRVRVAQRENLERGGTGQVFLLPATMGPQAENFSTMPTEVLLGLLQRADLPKRRVKQIDDSIRQLAVPKKLPNGKTVATQPFKNFKGLLSDEGQAQLYTGQGIDSTAGELRKAFVNRMYLKENQKAVGFNAEDVIGALTDEALVGVPKGYVGNTLIKADPSGRLTPSTHSSYGLNTPGTYAGTLGANIPVEALFLERFPALRAEFANKQGNLSNMAMGALEKRKAGVSEFVDDRFLDNLYGLLRDSR